MRKRPLQLMSSMTMTTEHVFIYLFIDFFFKSWWLTDIDDVPLGLLLHHGHSYLKIVYVPSLSADVSLSTEVARQPSIIHCLH